MAAGHDWEDNDLVFAHPTTGPLGVPPGRWWYPDHATHRIAELIADSGLPRIRPLQDLRHTHASLLLAAASPGRSSRSDSDTTPPRSPRAPTSTCSRGWAKPPHAGSRPGYRRR
jgi:integrase